MSHPDPLYDYEDMEQESRLFPWIDDNYDDFEDFYDESVDDYYDSMDGDHDSAMRSAGWGADEDYGYYGEDY